SPPAGPSSRKSRRSRRAPPKTSHPSRECETRATSACVKTEGSLLGRHGANFEEAHLFHRPASLPPAPARHARPGAPAPLHRLPRPGRPPAPLPHAAVLTVPPNPAMESDVVGRLASLASPPRGSSPVVAQTERAASLNSRTDSSPEPGDTYIV